MADVNEEIVAQYLKLVRGWFYVPDISFAVPYNYSNVDLLAFDPNSDRYYDIEVKYRSKYTIAATDRKGNDKSAKSVAWLVEEFTAHRKERERAIERYTHKHKSTKVLVTTKQMMGKTPAKRERLESAFLLGLAKVGFNDAEVWYFDDMIPKIVECVGEAGRYDTELLQTIRMLKVFGMKSENPL
jgi:hypothetical protein